MSKTKTIGIILGGLVLLYVGWILLFQTDWDQIESIQKYPDPAIDSYGNHCDSSQIEMDIINPYPVCNYSKEVIP